MLHPEPLPLGLPLSWRLLKCFLADGDLCVPAARIAQCCLPSPAPAALEQDKGHVLPEPDMFISAIGTRIYTKCEYK